MREPVADLGGRGPGGGGGMVSAQYLSGPGAGGDLSESRPKFLGEGGNENLYPPLAGAIVM